jgi:bifunctional DNA primase/polymerase-like protein
MSQAADINKQPWRKPELVEIKIDGGDDFALRYRARGWSPLPLPARSKNPAMSIGKGWKDFVADDSTRFPGNISILLGARSNGLIDIDLDCAEAIALAPQLLPATGAVFGRRGKPHSHWLYQCLPPPETKQHADPLSKQNEKAMLVELRSTGSQTVFPPSLHDETGEAIEWSSDGEPATIDGDELRRCVGTLAGLCLLVRHWPEETGRFNAESALIGTLLRAGRSEDEALRLATLLRQHAGSVPRISAAKHVQNLAVRMEDGKKVPGLTKLRACIGKDIADSVVDWMQLKPHGELPLIRIAAGDLPRLVEEARAALIASGGGIYQHGNRLVRIIQDKIKTTAGDAIVPRLSRVEAPYLLMRFAAVARWEKWSKTDEDWTAADVPKDVVESYLAFDGDWGMPPLLGVVTAPTLRPDGTVLDRPGYDAATGLFFDPQGATFPAIPDKPTKDEAEAAFKVLLHPLREFRFVGDVDKSVTLSAVLTATVRAAMPVAPMHGFSAPVMGSGKSMLVDYASVIATGERAAVTASGKNEQELEKRLGASMLAGDRVVSIDNVEGALGGEFLCQCLTQPRVKIRVLRYSTNVEAPNTTSFFATGNQLELIGDLTRRVLRADIDPGVERPELTPFDFDPVEDAKRDRPRLIAAALTAIRARLASGYKGPAPLGSYREWSRLVRDTIIWLGRADPVAALDKVREADPRLVRLRTFIAAWLSAIGAGKRTVADLVAEACGTYSGKANLDMEQALRSVALGDDGAINNEKLSWWFRKNKGRLVSLAEDGPLYRITADDSTTRPRWGVEQPNRQDNLLRKVDEEEPPF